MRAFPQIFVLIIKRWKNTHYSRFNSTFSPFLCKHLYLDFYVFKADKKKLIKNRYNEGKIWLKIKLFRLFARHVCSKSWLFYLVWEIITFAILFTNWNFDFVHFAILNLPIFFFFGKKRFLTTLEMSREYCFVNGRNVQFSHQIF